MKNKYTPFAVSVFCAVAVTVAVCVGVFAGKGTEIDFCASYYFLYYAKKDNAVSASSVSSAVSDYGGAGYILEYDGDFYVTVACYYNENDADTVYRSLKRMDVDCGVLAVEIDEMYIGSASKRNAELYKGNLNTLHSLSDIAYGCANALDTGEYSQSKASGIISNIEATLNGLMTANGDNCFCDELKRLYKLCEEINGSYIYSKNLRKLQIAITDTIINIKMY